MFNFGFRISKIFYLNKRDMLVIQYGQVVANHHVPIQLETPIQLYKQNLVQGY